MSLKTFGLIDMENLEFYILEDELWCIFPDGRNEHITEQNTELVKEILSRIREFYPAAYKDLAKWYQKSAANVPYYQFLMVNRFCRCNFGKLDTTKKDVGVNGIFNFEKVDCPMRGECSHEGKVCGPIFNSKLSDAELRVMRLVYDGCNNEEIADMLYISPHTVKNHIKSVYAKLGIHEKSDFIQYANKNNLFNT